MKRNPRVCVVGSINMDMVTTTDKVLESKGKRFLVNRSQPIPAAKEQTRQLRQPDWEQMLLW